MPKARLQADTISGVTNDAWQITPVGPTKTESVQEPDDDSTSNIGTSANGNLQNFFLDALPAASSVSQVDVHWRAKDNNGGSETAQTGVRIGGSVTYGTNRSMTGGTYQDFDEIDLARPGGGNWSPSDFPGGGAGTESEAKKTNTGGGTAFITTLVVVVTYTPPAGGFYWLLGQWLGPLCGASVEAMEVAKVTSQWLVRPTLAEIEGVMAGRLK